MARSAAASSAGSRRALIGHRQGRRTMSSFVGRTILPVSHFWHCCNAKVREDSLVHTTDQKTCANRLACSPRPTCPTHGAVSGCVALRSSGWPVTKEWR